MTKTTEVSAKRGKVIASGIIGNVMEWYDFAIYGYFAIVIGQTFFPSDDPSISVIAAFGAFAAGFLARPLGGVLLGRLGDVVGRPQVLMISIFMMAIPTMIMGLLPGHEHIGIAAPILVVLLRVIQGLSVGGEYTSSSVFLAEHAPDEKRGFLTSWSTWGAVAGILVGSGVGAVFTNLLTEEQITEWGWRIPFLMGGSIAVLGVWLRRGLKDKEPMKEGSAPVTSLVRDHLGPLGRIIGVNAGNGVAFYLVFVYSVTYMKEIDNLAGDVAFDLNTAAMFLMLLVMPLSAWLSDRIGRKPLMLLGMGGVALGAIPCFMLMHSTDPMTIFAGEAILAVLVGIYSGPIAAANVEQLPHAVRCTGTAVSYNLAVGLFGGTTPMIAAWLIRSTGNEIAPAYYLLAFAIVSFLAVIPYKEKARLPLE